MCIRLQDSFGPSKGELDFKLDLLEKGKRQSLIMQTHKLKLTCFSNFGTSQMDSKNQNSRMAGLVLR